MMGCEHMGDGLTCGGCIAKIGLREKLTALAHESGCRCSPSMSIDTATDSFISALLARFELKEKKLRFTVIPYPDRSDVFGGEEPDVVNIAAGHHLPVRASFTSIGHGVRAREYADFLNSKEPK